MQLWARFTCHEDWSFILGSLTFLWQGSRPWGLIDSLWQDMRSFCLPTTFLNRVVGFCLFEVNRHSPFGRDHEIATQNQQQDLAPIWDFPASFFPETILTLKMTQTGQGLKLIITEDGEAYSNPISWVSCINLVLKMVSQKHLVPCKSGFQGYAINAQRKTITAVISSWTGKHLFNHMLFQHLWIKKGGT